MRNDMTTRNQLSAKENLPQKKRSSFFAPWYDDYWNPSKLLGEMWGSDLTPFGNTVDFSSPAIDIEETADEYLVHADLPGIQKDDIEVNCTGNQLSIYAERKHETKGDRKQDRREIFYGTYQRSFTLPTGINENQIEASYENGVLTICVPKEERAKPKRIEIGGSKDEPAPVPSKH